LAAFSLAVSPVVQTLSNALSISRNKVTVALLLKPCVMRSTFLNNACVVEWPVLKLLVASDSFQLPKFEV
jgi:hypothetical protein